jgi:hypothetical protein
MLSQPQSQTESNTNDGQFFNHPFSFGAPLFSTTPLDTPQSQLGTDTPHTQHWFHPVPIGATTITAPLFRFIPEVLPEGFPSSTLSPYDSATQTKSPPQERPANLTSQVQAPAYYQPLSTQPIPPGDDSIDFGVAFDNTNSVDGIAITD